MFGPVIYIMVSIVVSVAKLIIIFEMSKKNAAKSPVLDDFFILWTIFSCVFRGVVLKYNFSDFFS